MPQQHLSRHLITDISTTRRSLKKRNTFKANPAIGQSTKFGGKILQFIQQRFYHYTTLFFKNVPAPSRKRRFITSIAKTQSSTTTRPRSLHQRLGQRLQQIPKFLLISNGKTFSAKLIFATCLLQLSKHLGCDLTR